MSFAISRTAAFQMLGSNLVPVLWDCIDDSAGAQMLD